MQQINLHHRKLIRLKEYNYALPGEYFVTICTHNHECTLGEILDGEMRLNEIGKIVEKCWKKIPSHFINMELGEFVVMPNHLHGIIIINEQVEHIKTNIHVGVQNFEPLQLGSIIRSYKAAVTRECRHCRYQDFRWQRNYYEHIIRSDKELNNIREYIVNNPMQWNVDEENPMKDEKSS